MLCGNDKISRQAIIASHKTNISASIKKINAPIREDTRHEPKAISIGAGKLASHASGKSKSINRRIVQGIIKIATNICSDQMARG